MMQSNWEDNTGDILQEVGWMPASGHSLLLGYVNIGFDDSPSRMRKLAVLTSWKVIAFVGLSLSIWVEKLLCKEPQRARPVRQLRCTWHPLLRVLDINCLIVRAASIRRYESSTNRWPLYFIILYCQLLYHIEYLLQIFLDVRTQSVFLRRQT